MIKFKEALESPLRGGERLFPGGSPLNYSPLSPLIALQ